MKLFYKICLIAGGAMLMLGIIIGGAGLVFAEATGALNRGEEYAASFSIEVGTEATTALLEGGELTIEPGDEVSVYQFEEEIKGLDVSSMTGVDFASFKETQYDLLARGLREHLDMKKIYQILEEGI